MYIISLKHTYPHDEYITLWRPNNSGYCFAKDMAGFYPTPEEGYHDNQDSLPISEKIASKLFQLVDYHGEEKWMIPNNKESHLWLGVKPTKKRLIRL